ncbi:DUF4225 domain-containing protein [Pseudomonas sp. BE134]|uniref:DUF4225 domain-containing protein n=1 Tax=Pseudomonas sp. BE134 TaxID=2817843 RepID=UPI002859A2BD|nr:DUF4225 domain-containing protein [Pseudomonas sp. BE134]MDR6928189.1 hypothetical protein [Pseudomonas sp. BE134]
MNEESCDIHDVSKAASDLVAVGCSIGMAHFSDGVMRLRFGSMISSYANEVIQAVDEGLISAWQGVQEITAEYEELSSQARFYLQNGIGVVAGIMQVRSGVAATAAPAAIGVIPGALLIAHGTNNIYEGLGNIYKGPEASATIGPVRYIYQTAFKNDGWGNISYYSMDLFLSGYGFFRPVQRTGTFELFKRDPMNYEQAFRQTGKLALAFEALVDFLTMDAMLKESSAGG